MSIISIREPIRVLGVFCETGWNLCFLAIPDNTFEVMEGVVGLHIAAILLLDAMESGPMPKHVCAARLREEFPFLMEGTAILGIGLESVIEQTVQWRVSSRLAFIPRVQISANRPPHVYGEDRAVLVTAQHN